MNDKVEQGRVAEKDQSTIDLVPELRALLLAFLNAFPLEQLPRRQTLSRFVNGRGQLLQSSGPELPDLDDALCDFLHDPKENPVRERIIAALKSNGLLLGRIHQCVHDGGGAYIQALDPDANAIKTYLLQPFITAWVKRSTGDHFDDSTFEELCRLFFSTLEAQDRAFTLMVPVLGIELSEPVRFDEDIVLRPRAEEEEEDDFAWSNESFLSNGIVRDALVAGCILEVSYTNPWLMTSEDRGYFFQPPYDVGFDAALARKDRVMAVLRLVLDRELPEVFVGICMKAFPWVRHKLLLPTPSTIHRWNQQSPAWNSLIWPEPMTPEQEQELVPTWQRLALLDKAKDAAKAKVAARVDVAMRRWNLAPYRHRLDDCIIDYWVGLEALFADNSGAEVSYKLPLRIAVFCAAGADRGKLYERMRDSYKLRSKIVHGTPPPKLAREGCSKSVEELHELLRCALLKIIRLEEPFDPSKLEIALLETTGL